MRRRSRIGFLWLGAYLFVMLLVIRPLGIWLANGTPASRSRMNCWASSSCWLSHRPPSLTQSASIRSLEPFWRACVFRGEGWQTALRTKLHVILSLVLLPLFFALTGIRTRLDLLNDSNVWLWTSLVLLLAVMARWEELSLRRAGQGKDGEPDGIGSLLNTRGLVELIVLNIAYNAQLFSPTLFTMLVIMALHHDGDYDANSELAEGRNGEHDSPGPHVGSGRVITCQYRRWKKIRLRMSSGVVWPVSESRARGRDRDRAGSFRGDGRRWLWRRRLMRRSAVGDGLMLAEIGEHAGFGGGSAGGQGQDFFA